MTRRSIVVASALALALGSSCKKTRSDGLQRQRNPDGVTSAEKQVIGQKFDSGLDAAKSVAAGAIPFDYPVVATPSKASDYVLSPSRSWIDEAFEKGGANQTFIYYGGWMRQPGPRASLIETMTRQRSFIPNAFIVAIRRGETVDPGEIVLTSWASGSGMQRAIVVEGGQPKAPKVRYLDLELENPSGWGKKDDVLKENTFHKLIQPGEVGSTVACIEGSRKTRWVITNAAADKLLVLGFAGRMRVFTKSDCQNLPIKPELKIGDEISVPLVGAFTEATVTRVDAKVGRVWAKYEFGGKDKEEAFSFTNVAPELGRNGG